MQDARPLAFYSRKLNSAQKRYTTGKQELLPIVETLKEFKNILLGQILIVHADHKKPPMSENAHRSYYTMETPN